MSKAIMILGASGSGKTTSLEKLDPKQTFYIDADGKGMSWKGWRKQYNSTNKNYYRCDDPAYIYGLMQTIDAKQPQVKYLIIDTLNGCMVADEMRRSKEKTYDKWMDLAKSFTFKSNGRYLGDTVFINKSGIDIGAGSSFPDRLVLYSQKGNITIGNNVRMDKAFIHAYATVSIGSGCKIKGLILANKIIFKGAFSRNIP